MSRELEVAIAAARAAGALQLSRFRRVQAVELKADDTPVTQTDRECEELIRRTLADAFPHHGFLGEEATTTNVTDAVRWIVDPLDGTKKYVRGLPFFGPSVALERDGEMQIGVLYLPALDELVWAERGQGAFLNGHQIHVSDTDRIDRAYVVVGNLTGFLARRWEPAALAVTRATYHDPGFLDLYTYSSLACGRIDGIVMVDESVWDIAAASLIVEEAGGRLTDFAGIRSVEHGTSVTSNGRLHDDLLRLLEARGTQI